MDDYTANAGYATWHARNWRAIPAGTQKGALPAPNGGLEVTWEIPNEKEQHDMFVSFIWDADGAPKRGSFQIVDWVTDEILDTGAIHSEDALTRIFTLATNVA